MLSYKKAEPGDLAGIQRLLQSHNLPFSDISGHLDHFMIAVEDGEIVGCAGLEVYEKDALLRSVAVSKDFQHRGIATELYRRLHEEAIRSSVSRFHLLTTTAEQYFARKGFQLADRPGSPASIQATAEFSLLCPSTARYMTLELSK